MKTLEPMFGVRQNWSRERSLPRYVKLNIASMPTGHLMIEIHQPVLRQRNKLQKKQQAKKNQNPANNFVGSHWVLFEGRWELPPLPLPITES